MGCNKKQAIKNLGNWIKKGHITPNWVKRKWNRKDKNNPRWSGGNSRGYILRLAKEALKKRLSNFKYCELCRKKLKRFEIHHKDKNQHNNIPANIILLCPACHRKQHPQTRKGKIVFCVYCGKNAGYRKPRELMQRRNKNKPKEVFFCSQKHQRLWITKKRNTISA